MPYRVYRETPLPTSASLDQGEAMRIWIPTILLCAAVLTGCGNQPSRNDDRTSISESAKQAGRDAARAAGRASVEADRAARKGAKELGKAARAANEEFQKGRREAKQSSPKNEH